MTAAVPAVLQRPAAWSPPSPLPQRRETQRLVLRWFVPQDAASMVEALDEGRDSFLPWLPWVTVDNRSLAEATYNIERFRRAREKTDGPPDDFVVAITDRATGRVLGGTGLHRIQHPLHEAEIGYWIRPSARGQGICTEAVGHLIDWAFQSPAEGGWGLRRLHIACAAPNVASRRVPEKLGLRQEAARVAARWEDGLGWVDSLGWGVTIDEWRRRG